MYFLVETPKGDGGRPSTVNEGKVSAAFLQQEQRHWTRCRLTPSSWMLLLATAYGGVLTTCDASTCEDLPSADVALTTPIPIDKYHLCPDRTASSKQDLDQVERAARFLSKTDPRPTFLLS